MTEVLVLRALGLGDLLTAVPALRGTRQRWPGARITLAAPEPLGAWLASLGLVDRVLPTTGLRPLRWAGGPPSVAVNLHGRGPESHVLLQALRPRRLLAFASPRVGHREGPPWCDAEHEVDRWVRLVRWAGGRACVAGLRLAPAGPRRDHVVVHPGAAAGSRRWPADRWGQIARELATSGHRVLVTGTQTEAALCAEVARAHPHIDNRCGADDLRTLAESLSTARLVLSSDTGVAHLATAFGTPSVVLFGPVSPARWGPRIDEHLHRVIWEHRRGEPAGDPHGKELDPCLARVSVATVRAAALPLLGS